MRVSRTGLLLLTGLAGGWMTSGAWAQEVAQPAPLPEITDSLITAGERIFIGFPDCVSCHGLMGRGTGKAPRLSDDKWIHGDGSYAALVDLVTHGVPAEEAESDKEMPFRGWRHRATDDEILAVAAYVWSLSHTP